MSSVSERFVFSNKWQHRLGRHIAFWVAWLVFHGLIYGSFWRGGGSENFGPTFTSALVRSLSFSFSEALLFMPVHMFLSYAIIYFLLPRYLFTRKYVKLVLGFALLLIVTAGLSHLTAITLIASFRDFMGLESGRSTLLFGLMAGLRGSNTVAGFATAIKLIKYWYTKNEENQQLERERLSAELKTLRSQLHPHFLFNTLNNLYSLTLQQSPKAPQMVMQLAELLRYILTDCNKPLVNLRMELSMLDHYIALEKNRMGERLEINVDATGPIERYNIAPLLLLPFVENSFKHGARHQLDRVWVTLHMEVVNQTLAFRLINSKSGNVSTGKSTGIGLQNIRKRLELIYPNNHQLKISDTEDAFIVNLVVPLTATKGNPATEVHVTMESV